ncbi:MAG TPA: cyclic nucleotide-binding domain-containing protein, partial [bacterium]|nr:cyclic nucleotide-binding domain-containing protein [bacterium]
MRRKKNTSPVKKYFESEPLPQRELVTLLKKTSLFSNVSPFFIRHLAITSFREQHGAGSVIFKQGEPGNELYLVVRGEVIISRKEKSQPPARVATLYAGHCFGEGALLSNLPRNATARAVTETELLVISKKEFDALCRKSSAFRRGIQGIFSERIQTENKTEIESDVIAVVNQTRLSSHLLCLRIAQHLYDQYGEKSLLVEMVSNPTQSSAKPQEVTPGVFAVKSSKRVSNLQGNIDKFKDVLHSHYIFCYGEAPLSENDFKKISGVLSRVLWLSDLPGAVVPFHMSDALIVHQVMVRHPHALWPTAVPVTPGTLMFPADL